MNFSEWAITSLSYFLSPGKRKLIKLSKQFVGKKGIEIGGPSSIFKLKGAFPIYLYADTVDGVNFSNSTIWEGDILQGNSYAYYNHKKGHQFIAEGGDLSQIENANYQFVLSCHSLEHIANPLKALQEWNRVLALGGSLVLILPNKEFTFDKQRPITTMEHLKSDFDNNVNETDATHFEEVNLLHDLSLDIIKTRAELMDRTAQNITLRAVHHHVFDFELIQQMLIHAGFKVQFQQKYAPFHLITVAEKIAEFN